MTVNRIDIRLVGISLEASPGQTLLEAALAAGVAYPHGCRSGRCGSCKSRLIEGEMDLLPHSRFALSEEEKAQGLILACRALPLTDAAVAWLDSDEPDAAQPSNRMNGVVTWLEDLTHDIKLVRIVPENATPLHFSAGQYAHVSFKGVPSRSYSMANRPGGDSLEFHIRRVPGGATSEHVHDALSPGDQAQLEFPLGSSALRRDHSGPILCLAGGSGLAPIKSIVETALAHGMDQPVHVYFGARAVRDLYLVEHFQALARKHANLTFTPVLSEGPSAQYRSGYVTQALEQDLADLAGWKAYVAGPPQMVDAAMEATFARGLQREDMHADVFYTPRSPSRRFAPGHCGPKIRPAASSSRRAFFNRSLGPDLDRCFSARDCGIPGFFENLKNGRHGRRRLDLDHARGRIGLDPGIQVEGLDRPGYGSGAPPAGHLLYSEFHEISPCLGLMSLKLGHPTVSGSRESSEKTCVDPSRLGR
ncbi:2Fe-2S iron-sulfur cluster-binding protein [Brevundimonas naejangsanensis]|uniref:2Fe-2S iron-sulfur cluster-binding protein n=1 Tax=Brevundimonas naejangsanensis TaxID=588932 RepID=UPI00267DF424